MADITLATLLAGAETKCTSGCNNGWINNMVAVNTWEAEHADALRAYDEERRRTRCALLSAEESALRDTKPPYSLECPCNGVGYLLTDDGRALVEFMKRHLLGGRNR